jgi:hypothetical protein
LVGEYPEASLSAKAKYAKDEWDFGRRLVCKFIIPPANVFWGQWFSTIPKEALLPPNDPFASTATAIKNSI